jgi:hypothetical protein
MPSVGSIVHSVEALALTAPINSMPKASAAATTIRFISPTLDCSASERPMAEI